MEFTLRGKRSAKHISSRTAGMIAALTVGASLLTAPQALAADSPTDAQLLKACGDTSSFCAFRPQSYWGYSGPKHQVGSTAYNCGSQTNQHRIDWSDTTTASNSVGVAVSAEYKFGEVFELSVTTTYSHTWQNSHTDTESNQVNIPSGHVGWIERGTSKQAAQGWWEIQFKNKYYGHYDWYVYNYKESGFNKDNPSYGYINFKDRAMTSAERGAHC
ncbi:hypothetical protein [Streptomyces sp. NPDC058457]|uniref:hypothetical protein n=1 Tax=Streptomyces sp. NPDC058457 TaxID=3346507 RepID=UPI0036602571